MASRNGSVNMESTGFSYPGDVPNVGERELLLPKSTGSEGVKRSFQLQVLNYAREVAQGNTGLLLIVAGEAFFAISDAIVQTLQNVDPPVTSLQLIVIRMTIIYMGFVTKIPDQFLGPKGVRVLLLLRGIGGSIGLFGLYYSLQYLSLSDAVILTFFVPTCTAISGAVFLGESFKLREAIAGFVSFGGVVLIARPPALFGDFGSTSGTPSSEADKVAASNRMNAVVISLIGVLGNTLAYTLIRAIGKRAHAMHAMVSFSTIGMLLASFGMIITRTKIVVPTQLEWLVLLVMIGVFSFLAQILFTKGLQRETASRGTLALYSKIIFATMLQWVLFHTTPPCLSVVGTLMIVASALYVVLTKEKPKETLGQPVRLPVSNDEALEQGLAPSADLEDLT